MKKSKFLASVLAFSVCITMILGMSAFAAEDNQTLDEAPVMTEAPVGTDNAQEEEQPSTPQTFEEIGSKLNNYSVKNPSMKFSLPADFECVTLNSSSGDIASFIGAAKAEFISYGYIALAKNEKSSSYFYITRAQDEYSKMIKNYNSLSKKELDEVVSEISQTIDQNTYSAAYDSTESVKINGQNFVKTTSKSATTTSDVNIVEYTTVHDGYNYVITYVYPVSLSESSVKNLEGTINDLKFSFSFDTNTVIPYASFVIGILALAISIVLFVKYSEIKRSLSSSEDNDSDDGNSDEEENYYGIDEQNTTEEDNTVNGEETAEELVDEKDSESDSEQE